MNAYIKRLQSKKNSGEKLKRQQEINRLSQLALLQKTVILNRESFKQRRLKATGLILCLIVIIGTLFVTIFYVNNRTKSQQSRMTAQKEHIKIKSCKKAKILPKATIPQKELMVISPEELKRMPPDCRAEFLDAQQSH